MRLDLYFGIQAPNCQLYYSGTNGGTGHGHLQLSSIYQVMCQKGVLLTLVRLSYSVNWTGPSKSL
jgi:hypothetical protein